MSATPIAVIGSLAAIGTTACWVPQIVRTIRTRSANDFSWGYLVLLLTGIALWVVYGLLRANMVVLGANVASLGLVLIVAWVKARENASARS